MKVVGLMSGTSGDGVDAALVDIRGRGESLKVTVLAFSSLPYPHDLHRRVLAVSQLGGVADICHLNAVLGELFGKAALKVIKRAGLAPSAIGLIGSHGQTVHHRPRLKKEVGVGSIRSTLQIAEPAIIAERTGITTVANFRPRDMAAGGQGAPLTPYVHYLIFRQKARSRLVVNLGGIGNVTYLPAGGNLDSIQAFDSGPGNMVLDGLMCHMSKGRTRFDQGGKLAASGTVDSGLLKALMRHSFLRRTPPKSTGREEFGQAYLLQLLKAARRRNVNPRDVLATCTYWTALTVANSRRWLTGNVQQVLVGGGGVFNRTVMSHLRNLCAPTPVVSFEAVGWNSKAFEAVAFAVLAYQTIHGQANNVPSVTGAKHGVVMGAIVPGRLTMPYYVV